MKLEGAAAIRLGEVPAVLLPERALLLPDSGTLVVADLHLGKEATFQDHGIPVPLGSTMEDLTRLSGTLVECRAERLLVLGDLIHARRGRHRGIDDALSEFGNRIGGIERILVRGNHDRGAGDPPPEAGFRCVDPPFLIPGIPLAWVHEPVPEASTPCLPFPVGGHVHPGVRVGPRGGLRAPAAFIGPGRAILPAFGSFTGLRILPPGPGDRIFIFGEGQVIEWPPPGTSVPRSPP